MRFVGRQDELQTMKDAWRQVMSGAPQCVVLIGEPRLGKTRLVQEFYSWLQQQEDPKQYWPTSLFSGDESLRINPNFEEHEAPTNEPPWLWWGVRWSPPSTSIRSESETCAALTHAADLKPHVAIAQRRMHAAAMERKAAIGAGKTLANIATAGVAGSILELYERVADWMEIRTARSEEKRSVHERSAHLRGGELDQLLSLILSFTTTDVVVETGVPLVLFLDDVHWADKESLRFFQRLCAEILNRGRQHGLVQPRILILATSWEREWISAEAEPVENQPELTSFFRVLHSLKQHAQTYELNQVGLAVLEVQRLSEDLSPIVGDVLPGVTEGQKQVIASSAGGSPGLLIELLRKLSKRSHHLFVDEDPNLVLTPKGEHVVRTMRVDYHELIEERLNDLAPAEKTILRIAAFLGVQFSSRLLEDAIGRFSHVVSALRGDITVQLALKRADRSLAILQAIDEKLHEFRVTAYRDVLYKQLQELEDLLALVEDAMPHLARNVLSSSVLAQMSGTERDNVLLLLGEVLFSRFDRVQTEEVGALLLSVWSERLNDLYLQGLQLSLTQLFSQWMNVWRRVKLAHFEDITPARYSIVFRAGMACGQELSVWEVAESALTSEVMRTSRSAESSALAFQFMRYAGEAALRMNHGRVALDLLERAQNIALHALEVEGNSDRLRDLAVSQFLLSDLLKATLNKV